MLKKTLTINGVKITPYKTHILIGQRLYYFNEYFQLQDLITNNLSSYTEDDIEFCFEYNKVEVIDIDHNFISSLSKLKKIHTFDKILVDSLYTSLCVENEKHDYYKINHIKVVFRISNDIFNPWLENIPPHWVKYL